MNDTNLSDAELVHAVDNDPVATPRERELANRLDAAMQLLQVWKAANDR
jgi:hypothetical protein